MEIRCRQDYSLLHVAKKGERVDRKNWTFAKLKWVVYKRKLPSQPLRLYHEASKFICNCLNFNSTRHLTGNKLFQPPSHFSHNTI